MTVGKRTLIPSTPAVPQVDAIALYHLLIEHADVALIEAEARIMPALREAIERRSLDDASAASSALERACEDTHRDVRDARYLARELADDEALRHVGKLEARFAALMTTAATLLPRRPPPPALPESPWLISHGGEQTAAYVANQEERAREWSDRIARADAGIVELDDMRRRDR